MWSTTQGWKIVICFNTEQFPEETAAIWPLPQYYHIIGCFRIRSQPYKTLLLPLSFHILTCSSCDLCSFRSASPALSNNSTLYHVLLFRPGAASCAWTPLSLLSKSLLQACLFCEGFGTTTQPLSLIETKLKS